MKPFLSKTVAEQVAGHLRQEMEEGRLSGIMPGVLKLEAETGDGRAKIRNAQLEAMKIKNTGMAVTIDIGSVREHPVNKYDVGLRLSRWAMRHQYGAADLVPSGPIYKSHKVEGSAIRVSFDHAENGLMLGIKEGYEPVKPTPGADIPWLSIQAKDGTWHWAKGELDGGSDRAQRRGKRTRCSALRLHPVSHRLQSLQPERPAGLPLQHQRVLKAFYSEYRILSFY